MKGLVFTGFLDMVEKEFGYEMVDQIIEQSNLESGGAYTAVGTYSHTEIVALLSNLSENSKVAPAILLKSFGRYFFELILDSYSTFLTSKKDTFEFLASIENHIHVEVRKLYPDAELPTFDAQMPSSKQMKLLYISERKMSDFAHGLIERTLEYYKETATISKELIDADGSKVQFLITKN